MIFVLITLLHSYITLKPTHDGFYTSFVNDETETQWVRVVEARRPRRNETAVDGVVFELDQVQRLLATDLLECHQLVAHGLGEPRETDNTRVAEEFIGGNVFRNDEVVYGRFWAG